MWVKWVSIATYAGITCLMRAAIGDIVAAGGLPVAQALLAECASVATAEGYPPAPGDLDYAAGMISRAGSLFTASMLRDLEAGAPVECQQILGDPAPARPTASLTNAGLCRGTRPRSQL